MEIKNLPIKYLELWKKCLPLLQKGRPDDDTHAIEVVEFVLNCGKKDLDLDVLVPTAIMHDIGHSAILPEHFKYITGQEKIVNGKLVHMLVGAKIAKEILDSINYDHDKTAEIVDIISIHDADQLEKIDVEKVYNSENKKIFHDIDCMDRYNPERLKKIEKLNPDKKALFLVLEKGLKTFFYPEFRKIAEEKFKKLLE